MQSYGLPHSLEFYFVVILIGASIIASIIIYNSHKRIQLTKRIWIIMLLRVLLLVVLWQVLFSVIFILIYTGGSIEFIRLTENVANLVSFGIIVVINHFIEEGKLCDYK